MPGRRILFVCVENACRSQMAEGFARMYGGEGVEAESAGSDPADEVDPTAVRMMQEVGYDVGSHRPEPVSAHEEESFDVVVAMGCGDACPSVSADRRLEWDLPDPRGSEDEKYREIRDEIRRRVLELLDDLGAPSGS